MIRNISRFQKNHYDLLVVGGGINGAAITYMAARIGAKVALLEKDDFAAGTSSKSSKLLHGGIRYLENFEFHLVSESLKERSIQYQNAPHLVKPLSFIIPLYKKDPRPWRVMKLGVWLYDFLSGNYSLGHYRSLSREELLSLAPHIRKEGLVGAVSYFDAQMDDARLCLENVLMADAHGAHVANHVEVLDFLKENGQCVGVRAKDVLTGFTFDVMAQTVVVTVGPWSDLLLHKDYAKSTPRLRPTKGAHILYKGQMSEHAFLAQSSSDRRVFFVIPFKGHTLIGTTDTDYEGDPDKVRVQQEDIDYLLKEASRLFPQINFQKENIITTFAGLRPLVHEHGHPSQVSRRHSIEKTFSGFWYVLGGKYTTYRAIAKQCVAKALPRLRRSLPVDRDYPLFGSGALSGDVREIALRFGVHPQTVSYLMGLYGSRYTDVLKLINDDDSLRGRLCTCSPAIRAQVVYAQDVEMARSVDDVFLRRLQLQYNDCPSRQCRQTIEEMLK